MNTIMNTIAKWSHLFCLQHTNAKEVMEVIKSTRNGCFAVYGNIPVSFIKHVAEYIASPIPFIINNY